MKQTKNSIRTLQVNPSLPFQPSLQQGFISRQSVSVKSLRKILEKPQRGVKIEEWNGLRKVTLVLFVHRSAGPAMNSQTSLLLFSLLARSICVAASPSGSIATLSSDDENLRLPIGGGVKYDSSEDRNEIFPVDPFLLEVRNNSSLENDKYATSRYLAFAFAPIKSVATGRALLDEFNMGRDQETPCWRDITRLFAKESCKRMPFLKKMRLAVE